VEDVLPGGVCSAVNWSEVAQRIRAHGRNWDLARALLRSYEVVVEPTTEGDAERAASRWQGGEGLSLADRLCLATGERLDAVVWTADRGWGESEHVRQVR
jgi:ribonuclease VapC